MNPEATETLGQRVKRLRLSIMIDFNGSEKPMTHEQLAERSNCCKKTIARIEADKEMPRFDLISRLAAALNVPITYLEETLGRSKKG